MKIILILILIISCSVKQVNQTGKSPELRKSPGITSKPSTSIIKKHIKPPLILGKKVKLWSTIYYTPTFHIKKNGIPVRDKNNKILAYLSKKDFCSLAMEGSGYINSGINHLFNYDGTNRKRDVLCQHKPSSYAKFYIDSKHMYGVGNKNNPLKPFYSIACDQKKFKFGQKFYIPSAFGVLLPNGKKHDGIFKCDDVGGLIKGNHIDTFIGLSNDWARDNPFSHTKSNKKALFIAYLL